MHLGAVEYVQQACSAYLGLIEFTSWLFLTYLKSTSYAVAVRGGSLFAPHDSFLIWRATVRRCMNIFISLNDIFLLTVCQLTTFKTLYFQ